MKQVASAASLSSGDTMTNPNLSGTPDYGYSSGQPNQLEPPEVVSSTSSNEEREALQEQRKRTPHTNLQKPRPNKKPTISAAEKRELKRKMLMLRAKKQRIKVKALVHHVPTEQDITDLLKEFTVDFLLKGYAPLVNGLRLQLLADNDQHMDKSHYLWLLAYFLKFATQLEIEMEHIEPVLSIGTISYLTYEGVRFFEDLELACRQRTVDLKPHLRRMHLVTTAIHEFVLTLCTYLEFTHLPEKVMDKLRELQAAVS